MRLRLMILVPTVVQVVKPKREAAPLYILPAFPFVERGKIQWIKRVLRRVPRLRLFPLAN